MDQDPLITVAIPTFNRCALLERTLSSVLNQDIRGLSVVVSDNASTDGTKAFLERINDTRIKVIYAQENKGMLANWQQCLQHARGKYFLLMSDDDALVCKDALSKLVSAFDTPKDDGIGAVFSAVFLERPSAKMMQRTHYTKTLVKAEEIIADFFENKVSVFPCATLLRTADLVKIGGYVGFDAVFAVDACAWIAIALTYGKVRYVDEPLALYRIHTSLSSSSIDTSIRDLSTLQALINKNRSDLTSMGYQRIMNTLIASKARVPLGYIGKKWRNDKKYGFKRFLIDLFANRALIFQRTNYNFILHRFYKLFRH